MKFMDWFIGICVGLLVVAIAVVGGVKIYKHYKSTGKKFNLTDFIDSYGDKIVAVLKDVVILVRVDQNQFASREEYEKEIIDRALDTIKKNYKSFGIDGAILNIVDSNKLAEIITDILHKNSIDIFSVIDAFLIAEHSNLYPDEVVAAAAVRK